MSSYGNFNQKSVCVVNSRVTISSSVFNVSVPSPINSVTDMICHNYFICL